MITVIKQTEMERRDWEERLKYWCQEAETSAGAAQIEAMAAREGFRGERMMDHPDINPKLRYIEKK